MKSLRNAAVLALFVCSLISCNDKLEEEFSVSKKEIEGIQSRDHQGGHNGDTDDD